MINTIYLIARNYVFSTLKLKAMPGEKLYIWAWVIVFAGTAFEISRFLRKYESLDLIVAVVCLAILAGLIYWGKTKGEREGGKHEPRRNHQGKS